MIEQVENNDLLRTIIILQILLGAVKFISGLVEIKTKTDFFKNLYTSILICCFGSLIVLWIFAITIYEFWTNLSDK